MFCALAAQKHHYALYTMCVYSGTKYLKMLESGYKKAGIKLDMGKCCIRFKDLDGVDLHCIGKIIAACYPDIFIKLHEAVRNPK